MAWFGARAHFEERDDEFEEPPKERRTACKTYRMNGFYDQVAIQQLMARYTTEGDRGRIDDLARCFTEDGELRFSGSSAIGSHAITGILSAGQSATAGHTITRHHLTTSLVDVVGDEATGRTYFQVFTDIGLDHHGVYVDRFVRGVMGWRIHKREVRIDWQSSDSLLPPLHVRGRPPST